MRYILLGGPLDGTSRSTLADVEAIDVIMVRDEDGQGWWYRNPGSGVDAEGRQILVWDSLLQQRQATRA